MSEETTTVELSKNSAKILDMIEKMSVLEMSELVKAMEDKFGVSAAAPVAVAAAAGGGEVAEEQGVVRDDQVRVVETAPRDLVGAAVEVVAPPPQAVPDLRRDPAPDLRPRQGRR